MVMSIRHVELSNTTEAAVVPGGASTKIGQDYSGIVLRRTIVAADVGTGTGQIRHALGMLMGEVYGGIVKGIISLQVFRPGANGFFYKFDWLTDATANDGYSIVTDATGVSTVRFRDGAAGNGVLAANDLVVMSIEVGNS
jgi:hypothetical protein